MNPVEIHRIAAGEFTRRQALARRKIAQGSLRAGNAERLLAPWAAIAVRLGAAPPETHALIAEWRGTNNFFTAGELGVLVADDICPRAEWLAALCAARDTAIAKAEAEPGDLALRERALGLVRLADHFRATLGLAAMPPPLTVTAQPQGQAA